MSARPTTAERVYRLLLRAYPAPFRAVYGREMSIVFRDRLRERGAARPDFWLEIVSDVARTAPALRAESLRARWNSDGRMEDGRMKPMGILALLIGLLQSANAVVVPLALLIFLYVTRDRNQSLPRSA